MWLDDSRNWSPVCSEALKMALGCTKHPVHILLALRYDEGLELVGVLAAALIFEL